MKQHSFWLVALAFTLSISACKPKQEVTSPSTPDKPPTAIPTPAPVDPQPTPSTCGAELGSGEAPFKDPIARLDGGITGDCVELKVSYSGGCKEHDIDLYWAGGWDKSIPAVAHLYVSHQSNGDGCEAIKSEKLSFNIKPLQTPGSGQVIVEVHAEGVPMVRLNYTY